MNALQRIEARECRERLRYVEGRMRFCLNRCRGWHGVIERIFGDVAFWREQANRWHDLWRDIRAELKALR